MRYFLPVLLLLLFAGCSPDRRSLRNCLEENTTFGESNGMKQYAAFLESWEWYLQDEGYLTGKDVAAYAQFISELPQTRTGLPALDVCADFLDCWMFATPSSYAAHPFCMSIIGEEAWSTAFDRADNGEGLHESYYQDALRRMPSSQFRHIEFRGLWLTWAFDEAMRAQRDMEEESIEIAY